MKRLIFNLWGWIMGYEPYTCTNCKKSNYLKNSEEFIIGYCKNCDHPIWK